MVSVGGVSETCAQPSFGLEGMSAMRSVVRAPAAERLLMDDREKRLLEETQDDDVAFKVLSVTLYVLLKT